MRNGIKWTADGVALRFGMISTRSRQETSTQTLEDVRITSPETQKNRRSLAGHGFVFCSMVCVECGILDSFLDPSHLLIVGDPLSNGLFRISVDPRGLVCGKHIAPDLVEMDQFLGGLASSHLVGRCSSRFALHLLGRFRSAWLYRDGSRRYSLRPCVLRRSASSALLRDD